jgi:hypothetical protein
MQLIKELSDIPKVASLLNNEYKEKLITDVNALLIKYVNEQNKSDNNPKENNNVKVEQTEQSFAFGAMNKAAPPPPSNPDSINALKSSFGKPSGNLPPPPPPIQSSVGVSMTRSIATGGAFQLKGNSLPSPNNSKKSLSLLDALGYISPSLTDSGFEKLKDISTPTDLFQLIKTMDGKSSLKDIYQIIFQNSNQLGKFLDKIYFLSRERHAILNKNSPIPEEYEFQLKLGDMMVALGWINQDSLEKALIAQKDGSTIKTENNNTESASGWIGKAVSSIQQNTNVPKKKLGDVMIDLNMITPSQLELSLTFQKWLKNLILLTR